MEKPDHRHTRLLRARCKRQCRRSAAEKRNDIAPSQIIEPHLRYRFEDCTASYPK